MSIEKWYKHTVESNQETPPGAVWDSIQDDLDLEGVWTRLEGSLAHSSKIPVWANLAVAASLALLLGFSAWFFWFGQERTSPDAPVASLQAEPGAGVTQSITPDIPDESFTITQTQPTPNYASGSAKSKSVPGLFATVANQETVPETRQMAMLPPLEKPDLPPGKDQSINTTPPARSLAGEFLASLEPEPLTTRFSIGILGQFANTWLLSPKTIQGLQSQELTATQATFGKNLGLSLMKPLSKRTSLKADLMFLSQSRQNYNEYLSGQYTSTSLHLDYSSLSLMLSLRPGRPGSPHSFQFGAYAGTLIQAREVQGKDHLVVRDEYSKTDIGLIGGYEYFFPITGDLFLGTGFYAKYGLTNAFSGNLQIPDYLNRTHNAAFIFSLSVNYSIK